MARDVIERALQLARSGQFAGISQIKPVLTREGYTHVHEHFMGLATRRAIQTACHEARSSTSKVKQDTGDGL
jgi:hypothetical protein